MKKLIVIALTLMAFAGCSHETPAHYITTGHYYNGYVIRDDGHIWDYETALVEPDSPVCIVFDNNCTPDDVTDDYIVNMKALD